MERERDIFLSSSFGFLSNDFSFKGVLHTVVVALESNALSLSRERKKERKKAQRRRRRRREHANDFGGGVGGVSKLSRIWISRLC